MDETAELSNSLKWDNNPSAALTPPAPPHPSHPSFVSFQVKVTQELKNTHADQLTRLHFKHQCECDLLEDMRYETHLHYVHAEKGRRSGGTDCQTTGKCADLCWTAMCSPCTSYELCHAQSQELECHKVASKRKNIGGCLLWKCSFRMNISAVLRELIFSYFSNNSMIV